MVSMKDEHRRQNVDRASSSQQVRRAAMTDQAPIIQAIKRAPDVIPDEVVQALEVVDEELAEEIIDFDTVRTFVHLFGFDEASAWLGAHRPLYFEALRRRRVPT
jgi:hypothetical protein